jgi:hypothetical protein
MFIRTLLAAAAMSAGIAGSAVTADAKTNITIGVGIPAPVYVEPEYIYEEPPPPPRRRVYVEEVYDDGYEEPHRSYRVSCGQAARMLRNNGYRRVEAQDCGGRRYSFVGWRRGEPYLVTVSARSGRIVGRSPL